MRFPHAATLLMIGGIEENPGPAAEEGSLGKEDLALQGRTSTGCIEAPGSIVGSGPPPYLLPSPEVSVSLEASCYATLLYVGAKPEKQFVDL